MQESGPLQQSLGSHLKSSPADYHFSATLQALVDILNEAHSRRCPICNGSGMVLARSFCQHCKGRGCIDTANC